MENRSYYGLFNEESGLIATFHTVEEAQKAKTRYSEEDELEILEICPDHPEQPREGCKICNTVTAPRRKRKIKIDRT